MRFMATMELPGSDFAMCGAGRKRVLFLMEQGSAGVRTIWLFDGTEQVAICIYK